MAEKSNIWKHLVAQQRVKEMLGSAFRCGSLGHAYLFCGEEGVGKFAAALDMAFALLCTAEGTVPCGQCASCTKIMRNSHPDFRIILPLLLDDSHRSGDELSRKGWEYIPTKVAEKVAEPYAPLSYNVRNKDEIDKSALRKAPSIPVDWIREMNQAILRGAVSGGRSVAVFVDIDIMNKSSANAMLKTLEEPPANTYLFLTTSKPEAVLPTIASRCQIVRFGHVPAQSIKNEIARTLGPAVDEEQTKRAVFYSMGSLGRAFSLINADGREKGLKTLQETGRDAKLLWDYCVKGDSLAVATIVDELSGEKNNEAHDQFFTYFLYLIRNSFLQKTGRSENYIDAGDILGDPANVVAAPIATERLTQACSDALSSVRSNGNIAIILVHFVMTVMEIIHGEEQQAG